MAVSLLTLTAVTIRMAKVIFAHQAKLKKGVAKPD
jgi:hypothetical protein